MEADAVLNLLDDLWFHPQILEKYQSKTSTVLNPDPELIQQNSSMDSRSKSDEKLYISGGEIHKLSSELEFEEVKGFMEIGFVFSHQDMDSRLLKIIPGRRRPYLSQAWHQDPLSIDWRALMSNEIQMKHSLQCWAHTLASALILNQTN